MQEDHDIGQNDVHKQFEAEAETRSTPPVNGGPISPMDNDRARVDNEEDEEEEETVDPFDEEKAEEELEETYFIPNAIVYLLIYRAMIFNDPTIFEHHEVRSHALSLPNPPIENFYPAAPDPETRKLRNYQMHGLAWLESRAEHGGGIFGDQIGLGKVLHSVTKINI